MQAQRIIKWLRTTGFPLEMEAASMFRAAGFDVQQSSTFPDPQTDKGREIDVLARDPDILGVIQVSFVLECKSSTKPWVVFTSDDALSGQNRLYTFGVINETARRMLADKICADVSLLKPHILRHSRSGYGFRQVFGNEADPAYLAAMGALKACHGVVAEDSSIYRLAFAFPVIVVDTPLFECSRKQDGELEAIEVSKSEFLFSAHIPNHIGCCVQVVTREHLPDFAKQAKQLADTIRRDFDGESKRLLAMLVGTRK